MRASSYLSLAKKPAVVTTGRGRKCSHQKLAQGAHSVRADVIGKRRRRLQGIWIWHILRGNGGKLRTWVLPVRGKVTTVILIGKHVRSVGVASRRSRNRVG